MRLIRISFGPFQLGNLEVSGIEEVKQYSLKEQLGVPTIRAENFGRAAPKKRTYHKIRDKKRNADRSRSQSRR